MTNLNQSEIESVNRHIENMESAYNHLFLDLCFANPSVMGDETAPQRGKEFADFIAWCREQVSNSQQ